MTFLSIYCAVSFLFVTHAFILKQNEIDLTEHPNWPLVYHDENCGRSKLPLAQKSIGGRNAEMGAYPWMARLVCRNLSDDSEMGSCAGSLINERYVITAAHCCVDLSDNKSYTLSHVALGEYDTHRTRDCFRGNCAPHALELEVEKFTKHPLFNIEIFLNDICLIRLRDDVKFTDYVQPICLPSTIETEEERLYNKTMTAAGWGTTENFPKIRLAHILQEIDLVVRPKEDCEDAIQQLEDMDWESQICAAGLGPGQSPCPGDSGGPDSGRHVLMGVVSAGIFCTNILSKTNPTVFTRVSNVMPWILNNIY